VCGLIPSYKMQKSLHVRLFHAFAGRAFMREKTHELVNSPNRTDRVRFLQIREVSA